MLRRVASILAIIAFLANVTPTYASSSQGADGAALDWFPHGVASSGGNSPTVTPGATQPAYDNVNSTNTQMLFTGVTYNDLSVTYHGSSSDPNYNSRSYGRWDAPSFALLTGVTQIGLFAAHPPTNAELKAGKVNNVTQVQVRCDVGSWATITAPSVNANAGGATDWNFTVDPSSWADGLHKCDAIITPTTGPDGIMDGPPISALGYAPHEAESTNQMLIDSGTRGVAGHILTIATAASINNSRGVSSDNAVSVGWSVSAVGVAPGTFIDGDSTHNATSCVAETGSNCTGAGGAGTYHLTGPSQTVYGGVGTGKIDNGSGAAGTVLTITAVSSGGFNSNTIYGTNITPGTTITVQPSNAFGVGVYTVDTSQLAALGTIYSAGPAMFGNERSYYFWTNTHGTLKRAKVFVCQGTCSGVTGSDSNSGTDATHPLATMNAAFNKGQGPDTDTYFKGKYGETVCMLNNGGQNVYGTGAGGGLPRAWIGYVDVAAGNDPLCGVSSDPGGEVMVNDSNTQFSFSDPGRAWWHGLVFKGGSIGGSNAHDAVWWNVTNVTDILGTYGNGGLVNGAPYMCMESKTWFGGAAICPGAAMVRNSVASYSETDGLHDVQVSYGNTINKGGVPMSWLSTGTWTSAAPLVVSNLILPSEITAAGVTLTNIFVGTGIPIGPMPNWDNGSCLTLAPDGDWSGAVASATSTTITFVNVGQSVSGECTNGATVFMYGNDGNHPDQLQLSGIPGTFADIFILNNSFDATYQSDGQAPFIEAGWVDGIDMEGNTFVKDPRDASKADATNGGDNNVIYANNLWKWGSGSGTMNMVHDLYIGSNAQSFGYDRCAGGGSILPPHTAGTNQQSVAAGVTPCYTTSP